MVKCTYCKGKSEDRGTLMRSHSSDYNVKINERNFLEDNVIGNSTDYSLHGIKLNYCPICGDKLD